jgi:hypothetical protein
LLPPLDFLFVSCSPLFVHAAFLFSSSLLISVFLPSLFPLLSSVLSLYSLSSTRELESVGLLACFDRKLYKLMFPSSFRVFPVVLFRDVGNGSCSVIFLPYVPRLSLSYFIFRVKFLV